MAGVHDKPKRSPVPNTFQAERHLKVSTALYAYKSKVSGPGRQIQRTPVPWIRIQGKWLEQAGFTIHTRVRIRVMKGCLVLTTD